MLRSKNYSRKKSFFMSSVASILQQIVVIFSGLILPRFIISIYGSETNGLISSITQFLNVITVMEAGVGTIVQAALYKPLSENDNYGISKIYTAAQRFFGLIAIIFAVYAVILAYIYPKFTRTSYNDWEVGILVIIISLNLFAQYFWGLSNSLLLYADQKGYVPIMTSCVCVALNAIVSVILMVLGASMLIVKSASCLICIANPLFLKWYVKNNYEVKLVHKNEQAELKDKWSGFLQHIAYVITDNTDTIILTIFSSLSIVSVYSIYNMVVVAIRGFLVSIINGAQALFGNLIVNDEKKHLLEVFEKFEILFAFLATFFWACTTCLIVPFVKVYTIGVSDVDYYAPFFAVLLSISGAMFCYRTVYYTLIKAAGHFRQTQFGAIMEAILNITVSVIMVKRYGLIGVAIGTIVAVSYRTLYCVWYLSKNILFRGKRFFIKNMISNALIFGTAYIINIYFCNSRDVITFAEWVILAVKESVIIALISFLIYLITYRSKFISFIRLKKKK